MKPDQGFRGKGLRKMEVTPRMTATRGHEVGKHAKGAGVGTRDTTLNVPGLYKEQTSKRQRDFSYV